MAQDVLQLGTRTFHSRLLVGTGKYPSMPAMKDALEAAGAEVVTVAVRRMQIEGRPQETLLDYIDRKKYFILPIHIALVIINPAQVDSVFPFDGVDFSFIIDLANQLIPHQ